jgi:PAS domain S-box-containing protein
MIEAIKVENKSRIYFWYFFTAFLSFITFGSHEYLPFIAAEYPNIELHAVVEAMGAAISLVIPIFIYNRIKSKPKESRLHLIGMGFLSMGVFDTYHALTPPGDSFVLNHSIAALFGGMWFGLLLLPSKYRQKIRQRKFFITTVVVWIVVLASIIIFKNSLPVMVENREFTTIPVILNLLAGILFLSASVVLLRLALKTRDLEALLFSIIALLQGFAGLTFKFSHLWVGEWWIWHFFRFISSIILLFILLRYFIKLLDEFQIKNDQLLKDIEERAALEEELRATNEELQKEITERAAIEEEIRSTNEQLTLEVESRKVAELEAQEREARFRVLFDASPDAILLGDPKSGDLLLANQAAADLFKRPVEDFVGLHQRELHPVAEQAATTEKFREVAQSNERIAQQVNIIDKNGKVIPVEVVATTFKFSNELLSIGIFRDISDRIHRERKINETLAELKRSNEELAQFAYVASHDLQEPLRMVTSFLQLIEKKYNDVLDDEGREYISFAVNGSVRMKSLILDLLEFSRVDSRGGAFVKVSTNELVNDVVKNLEISIQETQAEIIFKDLPEIKADSTQMTQVFQNLISNALKFKGEQPPKIEINCSDKKSHWEFRVSDNGIGIKRDYFEKIFVVFQRLHSKEKYKGTGIGLAITKKIVERHKGEITVESEPGKGSTFIFTIAKNLNKFR